MVNNHFPELPVEIEAVINQKYRIQAIANHERLDVQQSKGLATAKIGFDLDIPSESLFDSVCSIELFIAGTDCLVSSSKNILTPKDIIIRSLISAAESLKSTEINAVSNNKTLSSTLQVAPEATEWVIRQILAPTIKILRESQGLPESIQLALSSKIQQPYTKKSAIIDIIIPVYKGYDETLQCIDSVLAAKNDIFREIIVINDQSPDGRLSHKLKALAQTQVITLIENQQNQGFVASVNKGMRLHPDRDVVLLNADTVVCDSWLDRLKLAANKNSNIATVTPFSNNATICSFPQFNADNGLPEDLALMQLDLLFAQENQGRIIDLPTAVGFCMYIKRQTLNEVGYFDEKSWGKGYGEENDFCLRAATLGWRHVLAADVFVQHHGSVSFSTDKKPQLSKNLRLLNQRYPDYPSTVQRFIQQDPVARVRNPVIKKILMQSPQRYLLFVMHNLGGGAKAHADDLADRLALENYPVLELSAKTNGLWVLKVITKPYSLNYRYPEDYDEIINDLKELGVWRIHYHQTLGFPKTVWELPEALGVPYDFTAHDFMPMCPRINLIDETGGFCGDAQYDAQKCNRCIEINGFDEGVDLVEKYAEFGGSVPNWRHNYQQLLQGAEHIFAPSRSTAAIYNKHFNLKNVLIKQHPEQSFTIPVQTKILTENTQISVAVIGAIGQHKGYNLLLACAKNALKQGLPLKFVVIGFTSNDKAFDSLHNVTITGAYNSLALDDLITKHQCSLALFLSVWPETFCYTLTEAWRNGLYPVAFDMGAIAERINTIGYGELIPYSADPLTINQTLMNVAKQPKNAIIQYPGIGYKEILTSYYEVANPQPK
jgi:GT2 family glycosyltransferase